MIHIQRLIQEKGLEKVVKDFNLILKESDDLILLKYNQIRSNLKNQAVKESRGIILEKETYKVISLPFVRFTNHSDSHADKIDWKTARTQKKIDGSIIQLYYYNGWNVGTSGTLFGSGNIKENNITYAELFNTIIEDGILEQLNKDYIYVFELTTNKHTVVTKFNDDKITLLTIRDKTKIDNEFYGELTREACEVIANRLQLSIVDEENSFSCLDDVLESFKGLTYQDEGYVVVDDKLNRIKVKNPAWSAAHHNKDQTINKAKLVDILKSNEIIEFVEAYPNTKRVLTTMKVKYDAIMVFLILIQEKRNDLDGKELATLIHKTLDDRNMSKSLVGLTFSYLNSDIKDVYDFINDNIPSKKLLKYLK